MRGFRSPVAPTLALLGTLASCSDAVEPVVPSGDTEVVDGVLTVRGDAGPNDIRITSSTAGVEVAVDGETTHLTVPVHAIVIDAGAGDDVVRFTQTVVADLELTVGAGAGDDRVLLSFEPTGAGQEMGLGVTVLGGAGSDVIDFRWSGEGAPELNAHVRLNTESVTHLPEAADEVLVAFEHGDPDRPIVIGGLWNGRGPEGGSSPGGGRRSMELELDLREGQADVLLTVSGGAGADVLELEVDYSGLHLQQGRFLLDADLGDGDNHAGAYVITSARHTHAETRVRAGDGDNILDLEHVVGGDGDQVFVIELGDGENATSVRFGDGIRGARPAPGQRNVTGSYRSGSGRNTVELHSEIIEPMISVFNVDYGDGDGDTMGRYKVKFPWSTPPAPPGSQVAPSQTKVVVLSAAGGPIDLTLDVGDMDRDDPAALGVVTLQAGAAQQTDFDFIHQQASATGGAAEIEWTLGLRDAVVAGDAALVVDMPPAIGRLVYLQDAVEVAAGATMEVALRGTGVGDAVLAHLLGISGAGRYSFLADGGAGDDLLAVLTGDLMASDGGEITVDVMGGDGDDVLALDAPPGLPRDGPIRHAIVAGPGANDCYTGEEVPATDCDLRSEIDEELLALLEQIFGAERVSVWRARR